ncbi:lipid II:glycine glycyltransferase FemX [Parabacteroides sp.]
MEIKICKEEKGLNCSFIPVLARENYLKVKSVEYGWFDSQYYYMPFYIDQRFVFRRLVLPFGPIARFYKHAGNGEEEFFNCVLEFMKSHKSILKCDYLSQPQSNVVLPYIPKYGTVIPWGSYTIDLTRSDEEIFTSFHTKHKNVIRKAAKEGVIIECNGDYEAVWRNVSDTLHRQKVYPPQFSYYEQLAKNIPDNVAFYVAKLNGVIQGSAVVIYDQEIAYYMYGGSSPNPFTGSVNLLQYEIMKDMKLKGVKVYDMVGARIIYNENSKFAGIQRFKSRFSSDFKRGYILRMIFSPLKYRLFLLCVKLYGKLHGFNYSDSIDDTLTLMKERNLSIDTFR